VRRLVTALTIALLLTVVVGSPALAWYHDQIASPFLHALVDMGIVAVLAAPVIGLYWLAVRRGHLPSRR
jgi:uncharacterized ion transporter superfamily protein YfcC